MYGAGQALQMEPIALDLHNRYSKNLVSACRVHPESNHVSARKSVPVRQEPVIWCSTQAADG
jgi:hypothetical protein